MIQYLDIDINTILDLLYDLKLIISNREENGQALLIEQNIQISIEISKIALQLSNNFIGSNRRSKYLKKSLDECSFCLSTIYKNNNMVKYLDTVENILYNVELNFFHYIGKEAYLHPRFVETLNGRNYDQFEETYKTIKSLSKYFYKRKRFDLSRDLYDIKFTGQLLAVKGFETFALKIFNEIKKINELELTHINMGNGNSINNSNEYDKPKSKIFKEELDKLRMNNKPKKIVYKEVIETQNNEGNVISFHCRY